MAQQTGNFAIGGLNLYLNPLTPQEDGRLIRAVNVDSYPYGAKQKRAGYGTYVAGSAPNGSTPLNFGAWTQDSGTKQYTYLAAGNLVYYSTQGTGAWAICGNGTVTAGSHVGFTVLNNTLVMSQNGGTTRHSTNGTSFTDTSGAPAGEHLEQYQNRVHITGTSNVVSYSVTGDPTNWNTTGTSDGGAFTTPGPGLPNKLFKINNRLFISKNYEQLFKWDGYNLLDLASDLGLSSPYSYDSVETNGFWLTRLGVVTSAGDQPSLISNPIQPLIYNDAGSGIAGTSFGSAPSEIYRYNWLCAVGTVTDDFTNETIPNAILKYNYQKNEFLNYSFNNFPYSFEAFTDSTGVEQLIFADSTGQCYIYGGTNTSDNGAPIEAIMEFLYHYNAPQFLKEWKTITMFFNPGCQAQILFATSDTFIKDEKRWTSLGDGYEGVVELKFPAGTRSRLLYLKIIESSTASRFTYLGCSIDAEIIPIH